MHGVSQAIAAQPNGDGRGTNELRSGATRVADELHARPNTVDYLPLPCYNVTNH